MRRRNSIMAAEDNDEIADRVMDVAVSPPVTIAKGYQPYDHSGP
jgi:hypothetical protein